MTHVTQNTLALWWNCGQLHQEEVPITFLVAAVMTILDIKNPHNKPLKIKSKINAIVQDLDNAKGLPSGN